MMKKSYDVVVVGAGASGLIAASRAAEKGVSVFLIEKMERAGRKLLITGKGRCNITNTASQTVYYKHIHPQPRFLKHAFSRFFTRDMIKLLKQYGVEITEERGGRIYPSSNQSKDVLQALIQKAKENGVTMSFGCRANKIIVDNQTITGVEITSKDQIHSIDCQKVILCTGGKSYPATGSDGDGYALAASHGHAVTPVRPALVPLVTREIIEENMVDLVLKNVKVTLWVNGKKRAEHFGEMFFTSFGLSGPIILTLSRFAVDEVRQGHKVNISIDLKPALDEKKLDNRLLRDLNNHGKKQMISLFKMWLPSDLIPLFLERTGIHPSREASQITAKERRKIKMLMKILNFNIKGPRSFHEAIITAGGIPTHEINPKTMESGLVKNLHFAGELIDLDGDTGGYNLQIAWSTGWLAGEEAAASLVQRTTG
jgi:predicted Rossmann fold flavoprotein